jgi:hypothetical protein
MKKGDPVAYETAGGYTVQARVERVHRDGSVTVESCFFYRNGRTRQSGYLGYKYRMDQLDVRPWIEPTEEKISA